MRIVQIVPGSGGAFYCQNCLRDLALVAELKRQGHEVLVVPIYLPLSLAEDCARPFFYSAVSLYLRHRYPGLFRFLPAILLRFLESGPVLRLASRLAGSTRAAGLGDLTLSMLRGEDGAQAGELNRLVSWLRDDCGPRPDALFLSNALLLGFARRLKAELRAPVICWLQDEHVWADAMRTDESARVWELLRERAADADGFIAVSRSYGGRMTEALALQPGRVRVVHIGVDPSLYRQADLDRTPRTVGFLSRLAESEGFGLFVEAFIELHRDPCFADVRMKATGGGLSGSYGRRQWKRLRTAGLAAKAEIEPMTFQKNLPAFLGSLTLLSSPAPKGEAFGAYAIEAMASGLPVVEPPVGAYPELFQEAGCGVLSDTASAEALARAWAALLSDPARMRSEAQRGRAAVARHFNLDRMARETMAFVQELRTNR